MRAGRVRLSAESTLRGGIVIDWDWKKQNRRRFLRLKHSFKVAFKFLSPSQELGPAGEQIYQGEGRNISAGGIMMALMVPESEWLEGLMSQAIALGLNIYLPTHPGPIKALARVAWLEAEQLAMNRYLVGLEFREISDADLDRVKGFVIHNMLPGN